MRSSHALVFALSLVVACSGGATMSDGGDLDGGDAGPLSIDAAGTDATHMPGTDAGSPDLGPGRTGDRTVATTGADTGDCIAAPCHTFDYAGTQLRSGETLIVE